MLLTEAGSTLGRRLHRMASFGAFFVVWGTFILTASLDAGAHGDQWYHLESIQMSVLEHEILQDPQHSYNGLYFIPGYLVIASHSLRYAPAILDELIHHSGIRFDEAQLPTLARWKQAMLRLLSSNTYQRHVRFVFTLMASFAIAWVFLTILRLFPGHHLAAAAAASFLGLSWELSQRARTIEVDSIQMQFVALQLYCIASALSARGRAAALAWTAAVGGAAGLIIGCKISGILSLLPIFGLVGLVSFWPGPQRLLLLGASLMTSALALHTVNPSSFRDPLRSLFAPIALGHDYASVTPGHPAYVEVPFEHLLRVAQWALLAVPSSNVLLAGAMSVLICAGGLWLLRRRKHFALLALVYPVLLVLTLSRMHLLQLRNYTQLMPLLALAFGAAIAMLMVRFSPRRHGRAVIGAFVAAVALFNAGWLIHTDRSARDTTRASILADVRDYIDRSDYHLWLSPRLHENLGSWAQAGYACTRDPTANAEATADRVLMYYTDQHPRRWTMYRMGWVERTFGPLDINYDWYSTAKDRLEHHRVVLMTERHAGAMQVAYRSFFNCQRR